MPTRCKPLFAATFSLALLLFACLSPEAQDQTVNQLGEQVQLDRSRPVPTKAEMIAAWRKRQDSIRSFRFAWTEQQVHPVGWLPNPRFPQREWLDIPGFLTERNYTVQKSLAVDGSKMRYSYELNRPEEPDGVRVNSPKGETTGLGEGKHYTYTSVFDGQTGKVRILSLKISPVAPAIYNFSNPDTQTLDTRAIMMAFRPLDPALGHLLTERAVTNPARVIHRGHSSFLFEEQRDASGWKTIFRIRPESAFAVSTIWVSFEQRAVAHIEIDLVEDPKWGWVPNAWRITQLLADGTRKQIVEAKVTGYTINEPIPAEEFRLN